MRDAANYAYLNAQVSILAEQLLRHEQREQLLIPDGEQVDRLMQAAGVALNEQTPNLDSQQLEQSLIMLLIREAGLLTRSMDPAGKAFIKHWMRRFELVNLKLLLRSKFTQLPTQGLKSRLVDLGPMASLAVDKLLATEDIAEFLRQLESTPYQAMAIQARQVYQEKQSVFDVESVLDSHYYHVLQRLSYRLADEHKSSIRQLLGVLLDQVNLSWLLRLRFSYQLNSPHVYFLLAPGGHNLGMPVLFELAQLESLEQVLQKLPQPLAGHLVEAGTISEVELVMTSLTRQRAKHLLRNTNFNLGRAFAYLFLREQQLQLIHIAWKGRLLGLDHEQISRCGLPEQEREIA